MKLYYKHFGYIDLFSALECRSPKWCYWSQLYYTLESLIFAQTTAGIRKAVKVTLVFSYLKHLWSCDQCSIRRLNTTVVTRTWEAKWFRTMSYTVVSFFHGPVLMFPVESEPNIPSSWRLRFRSIKPLRLMVPCCRGSVFLGKGFCSISTQSRLCFSEFTGMLLYGSMSSEQVSEGPYKCHWKLCGPWEDSRWLPQEVMLSVILCAWLWQDVTESRLCSSRVGSGALRSELSTLVELKWER